MTKLEIKVNGKWDAVELIPGTALEQAIDEGKTFTEVEHVEAVKVGNGEQGFSWVREN